MTRPKKRNLLDDARMTLVKELAHAALAVSELEHEIARIKADERRMTFELLAAKHDFRHTVVQLEAHDEQRKRGAS